MVRPQARPLQSCPPCHSAAVVAKGRWLVCGDRREEHLAALLAIRPHGPKRPVRFASKKMRALKDQGSPRRQRGPEPAETGRSRSLETALREETTAPLQALAPQTLWRSLPPNSGEDFELSCPPDLAGPAAYETLLFYGLVGTEVGFVLVRLSPRWQRQQEEFAARPEQASFFLDTTYTGLWSFASRLRNAASPASETSTHFGWGVASAA